jgi:hypothetical protein
MTAVVADRTIRDGRSFGFWKEGLVELKVRLPGR